MTNHLKEIKQFDFELSKIIGKQLNSVSYFDTNLDETSYDFSDYHQVGLGVSLQLDTEEFYIIWSDEYVQFDIKFGHGTIAKELKMEHVLRHDLNFDSNWQCLIGLEIIDAKSNWNWIQNTNTLEKTYYPKDICLTFENGQSVFFSCTRIENEKFYPSSDELSIIFDEAIALQFAIGIKDDL